MENIQEQVINLLQIIIGGAISVACVYTTAFISQQIEVAKEKVKSIQDENARKIVDNALTKIDDVISTNIISAENTLKPQILSAISDGKVEKEELNSLAISVKENVLNQLSDGTLKAINGTIADINGYVENRIESVLADLKSDFGSQVKHTEI